MPIRSKSDEIDILDYHAHFSGGLTRKEGSHHPRGVGAGNQEEDKDLISRKVVFLRLVRNFGTIAVSIVVLILLVNGFFGLTYGAIPINIAFPEIITPLILIWFSIVWILKRIEKKDET